MTNAPCMSQHPRAAGDLIVDETIWHPMEPAPSFSFKRRTTQSNAMHGNNRRVTGKCREVHTECEGADVRKEEKQKDGEYIVTTSK